MIGISINSRIGLGDALQFSSLPENYFVATGKKLIDVSKPWFFDHNPYIIRDEKPKTIQEMWNFPNVFEWPHPRTKEGYLKYRETIPGVYLSNAEIWASVFKVPVSLNRPRLYQFEDFPYEKREMILIHPEGRSHGDMPKHIIDHVVKKYRQCNLYQIGHRDAHIGGVKYLPTKTLWELAELISKAKMLIGMDSGPSWIAACFPDIIVKKIRTKPNPPELFKDWVPLEIFNIHSHWDDRCHQIYNVTDKDIGFTWSYKRI